MIPWTFNIHRNFLMHKTFFTVEKVIKIIQMYFQKNGSSEKTPMELLLLRTFVYIVNERNQKCSHKVCARMLK